MKKGEKKKIINIADRIAFVCSIYSNYYYEAEKNCIYFGKMSRNDIHKALPLEIEFTDETISFWWWQGWAMDVKQTGEKMRNFLFGFTTGFFSDADIYVDKNSVNDGKMTLLVNF